jgi:superfamily I DNA/RNA helicase
MTFVNPAAWIPVGVDSLEPIAEAIVRSDQNSLVVAGPGSGKTELLAQRANYLLETGICAAPQRILAISFKRDAAHNLRERVAKRSPDRARRFDSFTLDAFAKGLVDRFYLALPTEWIPKAGYEVMLKALRISDIRDWMVRCGVTKEYVEQKQDWKIRQLFEKLSQGFALPYSDDSIPEAYRKLGMQWWREELNRPADEPSLTFPMLNRLAAFLLRTNPKITRALRSTYGFVFLDEFQDTTLAQYDLIRSAFLESKSVLTAVGDSKQRIMLWAGAMAEVFETFETDFGAKRYPPLVSNYRSAPELVAIQHVIAQAVESGSTLTKATRQSTGTCEIWEFSTPDEEAENLATFIEAGLREENKTHRDFCILVRQRTGDMIGRLKDELTRRNIKLRDESELQDLFVEPVVQFLLSILRLATRSRDPQAWSKLTQDIAILYGLNDDEDTSSIDLESQKLLDHARREINAGHDIDSLLTELIAMVGDGRFRFTYLQYRHGSYLSEAVSKLALVLQDAFSNATNATEAVDAVVGVDVVPAMTIHKSKGLEFDTVIFMGLEDSQWWSFATQADEEKRGFFVAFSRAIAHVYFTFCDVRDSRWGLREQDKEQIADLYDILSEAGVPIVDRRTYHE